MFLCYHLVAVTWYFWVIPLIKNIKIFAGICCSSTLQGRIFSLWKRRGKSREAGMEEVRFSLRQRGLGLAHPLHRLHRRGVATVSGQFTLTIGKQKKQWKTFKTVYDEADSIQDGVQTAAQTLFSFFSSGIIKCILLLLTVSLDKNKAVFFLYIHCYGF